MADELRLGFRNCRGWHSREVYVKQWRNWRISGEEMEEVKAFKYLGVWFDRGMRGNVQLEKMKEKAEEWVGKTEWMRRKDGQIELERGRGGKGKS